MLLHHDVVYLILQWLPVISLLRFKRVCKTWCALIESSDFIKQHLHHHHYSLSPKDKNHSLIHLVTGKDSPFAIQLISIDGFEEPNTCLQLDFLDLDGYFSVKVVDIMSYNGIICLDLFNSKTKQSICLWNPATKQSRVLPQLPSVYRMRTTVGFGFDVRNNDYKVVNFITRNSCPDEKRVEVYSLNTNSWKSITTVPSIEIYGKPRMPFNNGTCFYWWGYDSTFEHIGILCFDFSSEMFRSMSLPYAGYTSLFDNASVISDKITCVFQTNDYQLDIWALNEYGRANESWAKLYTIDPYSTIDVHSPIEWFATSGNYIFFKGMEQMSIFNMITQEMKRFSTSEMREENFMSRNFDEAWVEFKESLVSV